MQIKEAKTFKVGNILHLGVEVSTITEIKRDSKAKKIRVTTRSGAIWEMEYNEPAYVS